MSSPIPPTSPKMGRNGRRFRPKHYNYQRDPIGRPQSAVDRPDMRMALGSQQSTSNASPSQHENVRPQINRNQGFTFKTEESSLPPPSQRPLSNIAHVNNANGHQGNHNQEQSVKNQEHATKLMSQLFGSAVIVTSTNDSNASMAQVQPQDGEAYLDGWPAEITNALQKAHERARAQPSPPTPRIYVVTYERQESEITYAADDSNTSTTTTTTTTPYTARNYDSQVVGAYGSLEAANATALAYFKTQHLQFARSAGFFENRKQRRGVLYANGIAWYVDDVHGCLCMAAMDAKDGETWDADVYRVQVACRVLDQRP
ncbi:hypothetical protein F4779DRAFT_615658 [Xylariaceae sp. FL0662B]|nr:hypothetical protein F4779DRAFT_615658 [Xylariaceae sp. FL0662B]